MGYDCSITKRQGCNYCLRRKQIPNTFGKNNLRWYINDITKELTADNDKTEVEEIRIYYCPLCGKKLI